MPLPLPPPSKPFDINNHNGTPTGEHSVVKPPPTLWEKPTGAVDIINFIASRVSGHYFSEADATRIYNGKDEGGTSNKAFFDTILDGYQPTTTAGGSWRDPSSISNDGVTGADANAGERLLNAVKALHPVVDENQRTDFTSRSRNAKYNGATLATMGEYRFERETEDDSIPGAGSISDQTNVDKGQRGPGPGIPYTAPPPPPKAPLGANTGSSSSAYARKQQTYQGQQNIPGVGIMGGRGTTLNAGGGRLETKFVTGENNEGDVQVGGPQPVTVAVPILRAQLDVAGADEVIPDAKTMAKDDFLFETWSWVPDSNADGLGGHNPLKTLNRQHDMLRFAPLDNPFPRDFGVGVHHDMPHPTTRVGMAASADVSARFISGQLEHHIEAPAAHGQTAAAATTRSRRSVWGSGDVRSANSLKGISQATRIKTNMRSVYGPAYRPNAYIKRSAWPRSSRAAASKPISREQFDARRFVEG